MRPPRSALPAPTFRPDERAVIDAARLSLIEAYRAAGLRDRRDGFPFRQHRIATRRPLLSGCPRTATIRNREHMGLLLAFARHAGDPRLYVTLPYASLTPALAQAGEVDPSLFPADTAREVEAALAASPDFLAFARREILRAIDACKA